MKKYFLIMIFSVFSISMYGQIMIGNSENQIRKHFSDSKYDVSTYTDEFGDMIIVKGSNSEVSYVIGDDGICSSQTVQPDGTKTLKEFIEIYNENFIIKSDWQWKAYLDSGIFDVELRRLEGGGSKPFFTWYRAKS